MAEKKKLLSGKQLKISKAQQMTMIEVLVASLIVGVAAVLVIWLVKYIGFNTRVIEAKDQAIANYQATIINVGVCKDSNNDGKMSDKELENCDPNSLTVSEVPNSLRYNVMVDVSDDESLESVAEGSLPEVCYENGKKVDYGEKYEKADSAEEQEKYLQLVKTCSALRVIPDALPSQKNVEATMASLNKVFLLTGLEPESMSSDSAEAAEDEVATTTVEGVETIPMSWSVETSTEATQLLLTNLERSIREFNINTINFEWSSGGILEVSAQGEAYYVNTSTANETNVTISGDASKSSGGSKK